MSEIEAKIKAEILARKQMEIAEACVKRFEKWAIENKSSTTEEAHKKLVNFVNIAMMSAVTIAMTI